MSDSAFLDKKWKCRKCHQLAADHPKRQQGIKLLHRILKMKNI